MSFTGSHTEVETKSYFTENGGWCRQGSETLGLFWPNKKIKYFLRTLTEFKDFLRPLLNFNTFGMFPVFCFSLEDRF